MCIAIGSDPNAQHYKEQLINMVILPLNLEYVDFGSTNTIYGKVAIEVAEAVASGEFMRGVLLCGTGIGVSISANKVKGAFAALATSEYAAEKAVTSNNANILCIGSLTTGIVIAERILRMFLTTKYVDGTPSKEKLAYYVEYDKNK